MAEQRWSFKTGNTQTQINLKGRGDLTVLEADRDLAPVDQARAIQDALDQPLGTAPVEQLVQPGERVCIVTSDITRPCPSAVLLPPLVDRLLEAGIREADITIVLALGIHRPHTREEQRRLVGPALFDRIRTVDSNPADTVFLGTTSYGTPIHIDATVARADRRICVGNIEFHYFAGYSGGGKALMPGVSNQAAIQANHSRMVEAYARAGAIDSNLVRLDLEEAADICGCDFILNVVLDEQKRILHAVAGDHRLAHRAGCAHLDQLYKKTIQQPADLVVASAGGLPKDINLYQAQKALDNAAHAVRDGGIIILIASCQEGYGEDTFARWLQEAKGDETALIARVHRSFELGGHKAAALAMVARRAAIYLVSDLDDQAARLALMTPFPDAQSALEAALARLGPQASICLMPQAGSTLPVLAPKGQ